MKKRITIGVVCIAFIVLAILLTRTPQEFNVENNINKKITIELGEFNTILVELVLNDFKDLNFDRNEVVLAYNKEALTKVGSQEGTIEYNEKKYSFEIEVVDTTKPIFDKNNPKEIELLKDDIKDNKDFDITKYIKATDVIKPKFIGLAETIVMDLTGFKSTYLLKTNITTDVKDVKFDKIGIYPIIVKATDDSNNSVETSVNIVIKEKDILEENNNQINKPTTEETDKPSSNTPTTPSEPSTNTPSTSKEPSTNTPSTSTTNVYQDPCTGEWYPHAPKVKEVCINGEAYIPRNNEITNVGTIWYVNNRTNDGKEHQVALVGTGLIGTKAECDEWFHKYKYDENVNKLLTVYPGQFMISAEVFMLSKYDKSYWDGEDYSIYLEEDEMTIVFRVQVY